MGLFMTGTPVGILFLYSFFTVMSCIIKQMIFFLWQWLELCVPCIWHSAKYIEHTDMFAEWLNDCFQAIHHAVTVALAETPDKTCHSSSQGAKKDLKSMKNYRISARSSPLSSLLSAWTVPFWKWWETITQLCPGIWHSALYFSLCLGWRQGGLLGYSYSQNVYLYAKVHSFRQWKKPASSFISD